MESPLPHDISHNHCRNCGTELQGKFCHACGQKKIEDSERTFRYFFIQFLGSAFFLENNFLRNVWTVLARPGTQALDFIQGKHRRWMPPFSLFLLINLFYFWYTPLSDMNLTLHEQLGQFPHGELASDMTKSRIENRGVSFADYEELYNAKSSGYSTSLIIVHVPLLALLIMVLFRRSEYFYVDYFIVSLYFFAFVLLMGLIVPTILDVVVWIIPYSEPPIIMLFPWMLLVTLATYSIIYLKKIFQQSWIFTAIKTLVFLPGLLAVHYIYRMIQFFVIFWAT